MKCLKACMNQQSPKDNNMNKRIVFSTDLTLAVLWPITLTTGLIMHAAGHGIVQQGGQLWTALHTLFGILFFTASLLHIKAHWRWYKSLVRGTKCHSKITMGLPVAYLLTIVTAIILILQKGPADIHWGLLHYQVGILFSILGLCHLISRLKFLLNHFCLGK